MGRYAIVKDTKVINVVVWAGPERGPTHRQRRMIPPLASRERQRSRRDPQAGRGRPVPDFGGQPIELGPEQRCGPGWTYRNGEFIPPPERVSP